MNPDYRRLIDSDDSGRFERLCTILMAVEQQGSLRRATEELALSYRYAWGLIRKAEERIGAPLLLSKVGGSTGGGAELTPIAHDLLQRHRLLQREMAAILGPREQGESQVPEPQNSPDLSRPLLMASTIGPVEAGLVDELVTAYRAATGVWIRYIAAGTGQALEVARTGRVDLVLVHAPELEEQFLQEGHGANRYPLAENSFLLCGPSADPAGVAQAATAAAGLQRIAASQSPFVSRGDRSGTHVKELELWAAAGITPAPPWHQVWPLGGQGNAATLRHAASLGAYTLTDSATLATVQPEGCTALLQGDPLLRNRFSLITVNPKRFANINSEGAERFAQWAVGEKGRAVIRPFGLLKYGVSLFQLPE